MFGITCCVGSVPRGAIVACPSFNLECLKVAGYTEQEISGLDDLAVRTRCSAEEQTEVDQFLSIYLDNGKDLVPHSAFSGIGRYFGFH